MIYDLVSISKIISKMQKNQKKRKHDYENGFAKWGGYMNAKISKLEAQFDQDELSINRNDEKVSNLFKGVSIFVNGYTEPSADELRFLMLQHGGVYHHYYRSGKTTHIIASSLPNAKFEQMKHLKVVKSEWITESIKTNKLLDYKKFLLLNDFPNVSNSENILMKFVTKGNKKDIETPKTAADEGYLKDFYNNSRLHYISALKAMLKQHVQEMRENHNGIFPGCKRLMEDEKYTPDDKFEHQNFQVGSVIMHIDIDCFFVAVALKKYPHLKGQPVAVTHAKGNSTSYRQNVDRKFEFNFYKKKMKSKIQSTHNESSESDEDSVHKWANEQSSMSEIASCSYEARKLGVCKGMYLGVALKLCPNLKTVPYDFEGYKEVSMTLYNTVAEFTLDIEAISCDELFVDCTNLMEKLKISPLKFAEVLRKEILEKTKCTSSVGIGCNKLQARLATKHAKPNGQFFLTPDKVENFMKELEIGDIPGVGRTFSYKLKSLKIKTCEDLQKLSLAFLKKEFGGKTGETLYKYCRGEDDRKVSFSNERKSVSAEVNYGIRFNDVEETETFLKSLSEEVSKRLKDLKMIGKNIMLKVMFRAKNAPVETAKFLGHGVCDQVNRSVGIPVGSNDGTIITNHVISLYHQLDIPPNELRGIGIQVTKLEPIKNHSKTLQSYFLPQQNKDPQKIPPKATKVQQRKNKYVKLPTASQIDYSVLASLPEDIKLEVLQEYGLLNFPDESDSCKNRITGRGKNHTSELEEPSTSNRKTTEEVNIDKMAHNLCSLTISEIRVMIKEWVAVESNPQSFDIDMLKSYLSWLIQKKKLESLSVLIKCLHRNVVMQQKDSQIWKTTYSDIVHDVQTSMQKTFGKTLEHEIIF